MIELKVPTLGESVTEATVGTWFKKAGDNVTVDEMICELETDKVTIEVPSTINGVVSKIVVKEGETVELDAVLALLEEGAAAVENNEREKYFTELLERIWQRGSDHERRCYKLAK